MAGAPLTLNRAALGAGVVASDAAPRAVKFTPPPLPRRGRRHDALTPVQRHAMVGAILALHVAGLWGLLQIREVREAVAAAAPMFVSLVAPPKPVLPAPPPAPRPQPVAKKPPPVVIAAPP